MKAEGSRAGYVLARLYLVASAFVRDPASSTVLQFVGTFGVWDQVIWPRAGLVVGLAIVFAPVNVAAYLYTPPLLRGAAVGLLSLLRNEGGSVGTSLAQTFQERREQFHTLRLGESLDPFNPAVQSFLEQAQARFLQQTGDPAAAQQLAWQALENLRHQQASALAYFDCFWLFAVVMLAVTFVVFLMKRSVAEKGARWRMNRFANASGCML
jgi:DHA2 family multidrug resistance protein